MRRNRFDSTVEVDGEIRKPGLLETLLFDLRQSDQEGSRIASERVRALTHMGLYLTASHSICAVIFAIYILTAGPASSFFGVIAPLAGVILLAGWTSLSLTRERTKIIAAHVVVRLWIVFIACIGCLWYAIINASLAAGPLPAPIIVALAGAYCLTIVGFVSVPVLLITSYLLGTGAYLLVAQDLQVAGLLLAFGGCLLGGSLFGAQGALMAAARRLATERRATKAAHLLADFEQSGRGWFWETDANGALTYISRQVAAELKCPYSDMLGQKFLDLLNVEEEDGVERSLAFSLSSRLSFGDLAVQPAGHDEIWWSISGTPHFEDHGRFMGFSGIGADLSEKKRSEAEINRLARFDALTGLANRVMMKETLEEAIRAIAKHKRGCALFLIDLDRFKNVNDTLGHPVGDALLKQVAERLRAVIGSDGCVGRLGGDEFQAIFPNAASEVWLADIARRTIERLSAPYSIEDHAVSIGASIGVSIAHTHYQCADALVRDADLALYAAKDAGRGVHRIFAPDMHADAQHRQTLEQDLRRATERGQLKLLYQPVVNARSEALVSFEALLRWHHPQLGSISPGEFIPLAEECGLIVQIGEWALRTACAEAAKWPDPIRVAVNISPLQFADPRIVETIVSAATAAQLDLSRLELEITEGVFLSDSAGIDETFKRLKALGARIALDDFGTGYSSLGYLKRAPLDKLKIDQSFVRGAAASGSASEAILHSIISLAASLKMDTVAEGVESHDDLKLVRELGCSQVQGYIFWQPMSAEDALALAVQGANIEASGYDTERAPRQSLLRKANLQCDGLTIPVRIRNISTGGLMAEVPYRLREGAMVQVDMFGCGTLHGEVRWSDEGHAGLRFKQSFDLRKLGQAFSRTSAGSVRPDYLDSELDPASPWAGRRDRLTATELRRTSAL